MEVLGIPSSTTVDYVAVGALMTTNIVVSYSAVGHRLQRPHLELELLFAQPGTHEPLWASWS